MTIPGFTTVVFAQHDGVDIELDFKLPSTASAESKVPILLWFHGGGLLQGTRLCESQNYTWKLISSGLAPPSKRG